MGEMNPLSPHVAFLITPLVPADVFDDKNVTSFVHGHLVV
jgi:hypothetical protein